VVVMCDVTNLRRGEHTTENDVEAISLLAEFAWEIADRKQAEEKMLRSEQRLRLHSEQSPLGFLERDDHFRAIEWNAACERISGYTRQEAVGRHAKDLILPAKVRHFSFHCHIHP
jgi:PAS domain-containing protein